MTTTLERVPFGAQGLRDAYTVNLDPAAFVFDPERQINVTPDGGTWALTPMAASSTATNNDSTGGADEQSDPYAFPGDAERL